MAFIVSLITDAIVADLTDALSMEDASGSNLVRLGRLQDSPEEYKNPILVHENDPTDPGKWTHGRIKHAPIIGFPYDLITPGYFEQQGTEAYYRRFTIELVLFLTNQGLERDPAKKIIDLVHGRCIHGLRGSSRLPGLKDEFGELVMDCTHGVAKSEMTLSGGPPDSWIGNGKIWFEVWTMLPPVAFSLNQLNIQES